MRRSAQTPVKVYHPPSGFTVRSLAGEKEAPAYVELHQSVFESKTMTVEWRSCTLKHSAYKADLDIVVESPQGQLVAFCICWFDENSSEGQIEPLGCHKDFRQYASDELLFLKDYIAFNHLVQKTSLLKQTVIGILFFDFTSLLIFRLSKTFLCIEKIMTSDKLASQRGSQHCYAKYSFLR